MGSEARVEHRSQNSEWLTPEHILERVRRVGKIDLDPASCKGNPTKARVYLTPERDGLVCSWTNMGLVFVNPPYGRAYNAKWAEKIGEEAHAGAEIIALVAARTGSRWWKAMWTAEVICFVSGRLRFVGATNGAPFDSALCYWGSHVRDFCDAMKDLGTLISP